MGPREELYYIKIDIKKLLTHVEELYSTILCATAQQHFEILFWDKKFSFQKYKNGLSKSEERLGDSLLHPL